MDCGALVPRPVGAAFWRGHDFGLPTRAGLRSGGDNGPWAGSLNAGEQHCGIMGRDILVRFGSAKLNESAVFLTEGRLCGL